MRLRQALATIRKANASEPNEDASLREAFLTRPRRELLPPEGAWGLER